mgnify:CR=1 FL=1
MAKYDTYTVSLRGGNSLNPITRQLSVLFEDGDEPIEVLKQADLVLLEDAADYTISVRDALIALNEQEMVDLLLDVVSAQMNAMTSGQRQYRNRLKSAIDDAYEIVDDDDD